MVKDCPSEIKIINRNVALAHSSEDYDLNGALAKYLVVFYFPQTAAEKDEDRRGFKDEDYGLIFKS